MTGQEFYDNLPENNPTLKDKMLLQAIDDGILNFDWTDITSITKDGAHTAVFSISADAAYVNLDDGSRYRPEACARTLQLIADKVSASLLTVKLMDLRHAAAPTKLDATILPAGAAMTGTAYSKTWNKKLEAKRGELTMTSDVGKPFVLSNSIGAGMGACLYGFFDAHGPDVSRNGYRLWQSLSDRHLPFYSDYSSTILLVKKDCQLDGNCSEITDIMKDPSLCELLSYEGVLKYLRQP